MLLTLSAADTLAPMLGEGTLEASPAVSPDGRLLAYVSNSTGNDEVYVGPVAGTARQQVSRRGGSVPRWSLSGRELYFRVPGGGSDADTLYAARVTAAPDLAVSNVRPVLEGVNLGGGFGVLAGDTAFVVRPQPLDNRRPLVVVVNIAREIERALAALSGPGAR
jgi:dipeptidyl aminopeptidase/acylaminoacyl peptidase